MSKKLLPITLSLALTFSLGATSFASNNVLKEKKNNNANFISGKLTNPSSMSPKEIVLDYFNKNEYKALNKQEKTSKESFIVKSQGKGKLGNSFIRLQQVYDGIPVFGYDQVSNVNPDGIITSISGAVMPNLESKLEFKTISLNKNDAIEIVKSDLNIEDLKLDKKPNSELYIYTDGEQAYYAYKVNVNFLYPEPGNWNYFINAETGEVLNKYNKIHTGKPSKVKPIEDMTVDSSSIHVGEGTTLDNRKVDLNTYLYNGSYYLYDATRPYARVLTHDANNTSRDRYLPGDYVTNTSNTFNTERDKAAVSAHVNAATVADYYKTKFNRDSFDNRGALLRSSVHYGRNYNNAFWNGSQMVYGDGDGNVFTPLSGALDVVAHELTHAVTDYTADLIYQYESGAINEAMSDIFGAAVEFEYDSNPNWLIGEDISGPGLGNPALRSMEDPAAFGDPDHYSNRYTGTQDNGGVHINSSIVNKAAQLMADGGSHYGVRVTGFGVEKMEEIFYRALTQHMTSSTNFSQLRATVIQSASELYGSNSAEVQTVNEAFDAVGIH